MGSEEALEDFNQEDESGSRIQAGMKTDVDREWSKGPVTVNRAHHLVHDIYRVAATCQNGVASQEEECLALPQLTVEDNASEGLNQGRATAEGRGLAGNSISYIEPVG